MSSTNIKTAETGEHLTSFGGRLKAARLAMFERFGTEMTQTDLAELAGVTRGTVSGWESGAYEPPRDTTDRLGAILSVTGAWLREGVGERLTSVRYARPSRKVRRKGGDADQRRRKGA